MKISKRSCCPVSSALDFLGDKWSLLIVRDIIFQDKITFKEFLESDEKISTNILSDRLSRLEAQGIISKSNHPLNKVVKIYRLTPKGLDLLPILFEFILWSNDYLDIADEGRVLAEEIHKDRQGLLESLRKKHL
ncbi:MAG: winged helix-turn-helix transcriptional regulator [Anaerolineae bacterium]